MSEQQGRVVAIGEVMIEMARGSDGRFALGCGGDTFNTAVYLARAGIPTAFATALGDDPFSDGILALAAAEGVRATSCCASRPPARPLPDRRRRQPASAVSTTGATPRRRATCSSWRTGAASPKACSRPSSSISPASRCRSIPTPALGRFLAIVEMARQHGVKVAFDGNFRPRGWKGDLTRTRTVFMEALKRVDIAMPTYDDEAVLWGDPEPGGDGRAAAGVRHRRDRGEERTQQRAGRVRRQERIHSGAGGGGAGRYHSRPATASMPPISRRGFPATARARRPAPPIASPPR